MQAAAALLTVVPLLLIPVRKGNSGMTNIVQSVGALDRVELWQNMIGRLVGVPGFAGWSAFHPFAAALLFGMGLLAMFVVHACAARSAWNGTQAPFWHWLAGPVISHVVMIAMVPSNADVFYYEMSGDLANRGINPYLHRLAEFPTHPLLPYNHWVDMATVYGPLWTQINALLMRATGPDPVIATIVYKVLLGISALLLAGVVFHLAHRLTGSRSRAIAAFVLVAWQPNMILESSGQAHNDPVMLLLCTLGLALVLLGGRSGIRGALVLVAASARIKYVTLPLLGVLGLLRLFGRPAMPALLRAWALDGVAVAAVISASFLPYWGGSETVREMMTEPGRIFTHPAWHYQLIGIGALISTDARKSVEDVIRVAMQIATFAGVGYSLWIVTRAARSTTAMNANRSPAAWRRAILLSWSIILSVLAFVPVNSHAWYWTWPVVPISLLLVAGSSFDQPATAASAQPFPRWFWPYMVLTAALTLVYHARIVRL
ncbi:MAG: hypothetical protein AVDCRST_MAG87-1153 [uncultured Thermomicrobiales bacterium]|uniref:Uncharacterized protein n=1 Tax=uncultured Thermomicrobiales bacterium TaxID=1645740 RepID=A0A6J4UQ02_9BACT|nr:MAG: hypothetical protein AVDCRST_MAG87-1153 [uncultured Thermomicrobiales bacterium]